GNDSWNDKIYISNSFIFNPDEAQLIRNLVFDDTLLVDSTIVIETEINIPIDLLTGNYYIHIHLDADDAIYEYTGESNNRSVTQAIFLSGYPPIDLAVVQVGTPLNVNSGSEITVSWTVENLSENPTISPAWFDAVYLSTDTILNRNKDILLKDIRVEEILNENEQYSRSTKVVIPQGISNDWYIIISVDNNIFHNDIDRLNNIGFQRESMTGQITPTIVNLTPPPDLIISDLNIDAEAVSGQPFTIRWSVKNLGPGATEVNSWVDRFYISSDFILDPQDRIIGSVNHRGQLGPGESYSDTMSFTIPINNSGNLILIAKTDVNNSVFEHKNEDNNTASASLNIEEQPPSDLAVININFESPALAGELINIKWSTKNNGRNPATGQLQEAVYLSSDQIWDENDVLLGVKTSFYNLAPQAIMINSLGTNLSGVILGEYYIIVRTDILNNILESNEQNNIQSSDSKLNVDVKELQIGITAFDTLSNNRELYYRIEISENLKDESLLVLLKADSI
ncbi:MAG: CARDB domain-containing protein, partial [Melioribacteraceae bacterium]|nr:CARDB domain-containing protein [Melioribacteraceae bacterium]